MKCPRKTFGTFGDETAETKISQLELEVGPEDDDVGGFDVPVNYLSLFEVGANLNELDKQALNV